MDLSGIAAIIVALIGTGGVGAVVKLIVEYGRRLEREEQTKRTLAAKDEEITELKAEVSKLTRWVEDLTRPPGRSL